MNKQTLYIVHRIASKLCAQCRQECIVRVYNAFCASERAHIYRESVNELETILTVVEFVKKLALER